MFIKVRKTFSTSAQLIYTHIHMYLPSNKLELKKIMCTDRACNMKRQLVFTQII